MPVGPRYRTGVTHQYRHRAAGFRKKEAALESVNTALLRTINPAEALWTLSKLGKLKLTKWSFVGKKGNQRWLWHAIDHHTGQVLAHVLAAAKTRSFCSSALLSPSGSLVFIRIIGGRTNAISHPTCIVRANGTPRKSSASI